MIAKTERVSRLLCTLRVGKEVKTPAIRRGLLEGNALQVFIEASVRTRFCTHRSSKLFPLRSSIAALDRMPPRRSLNHLVPDDPRF